MKHEYLTVEPEVGETYAKDTWAVYGHYTYPEGSVLEGQEARCYVQGGYETPEEAMAAHPGATLSGSSYVSCEERTRHLPDDDGWSEADDYRHEE